MSARVRVRVRVGVKAVRVRVGVGVRARFSVRVFWSVSGFGAPARLSERPTAPRSSIAPSATPTPPAPAAPAPGSAAR
eukprot:3607955-Prymnesium_polylepis.1